MKLLRRNTKVYFYASYIGKSEIKDENGFYTGESKLDYSPVKTVRGNLSPVTGGVTSEAFGTFTDYNAVLVTDDMSCDVKENDILWLTKPPMLYVSPDSFPSENTKMQDTNSRKNGIVKRIARTKNVLSVAVKLYE